MFHSPQMNRIHFDTYWFISVVRLSSHSFVHPFHVCFRWIEFRFKHTRTHAHATRRMQLNCWCTFICFMWTVHLHDPKQKWYDLLSRTRELNCFCCLGWKIKKNYWNWNANWNHEKSDERVYMYNVCMDSLIELKQWSN